MSHELSLSIVGSGGDGAVAAGDILSMACARDGLHVIKTEAYGPQIRGGESSCTVRISSSPVSAQADALKTIIVFNWADFSRFRAELALAPDAVVFHEEKDPAPEEMKAYRLVPVAFAKLATDAGARGGKNILALGLLAEVFGLPMEAIRAAVRYRFIKKGDAVIEANLNAFNVGITTAAELGLGLEKLEYTVGTPKLLMAGNEACAVGAVEAGCRFFAGYPITPSSEVLHFLGEWLPRLGGTSLQTEDELAAIGAVVGASFAGVKSMTATSGPGLSLMSEMLGLSMMAELPTVIYNVQRGGPSTGIPTKSEQSDLMHSLFGGHGDTPRVVLTCTDVEDSFHMTVEGFNIAEEFQIPVIVQTEQSIAQSRQTIDAATLVHDVIDRQLATAEELVEYRRYKVTDSGSSPMAVPGMRGGEYQTNGLEHDELGRPSSMYTTHATMNAKRYRKLDAIAKKYRLFTRYGVENPELGILCWGSSTGIVSEAIDRLKASGLRVALFSPRIIMPLPAEDLQQFVDSAKQLLVVELSFAQQFYKYLRTEIDLPRGTNVYARSGGKNLTVTEVVIEAERILARAENAVEVLA
ncbi:MAG: 2-oxoacid:acceptor oxidoreductase subunit alpha [Thermoanaerobaculia bacterium]